MLRAAPMEETVTRFKALWVSLTDEERAGRDTVQDHAARLQGDDLVAAASSYDQALVGGVVARDGGEDEPAIIGGAAHRAELVEGPTQRHRAVAADTPVGGAQTRDTTER